MIAAYREILRRPRPVSAHRRMPVGNRAKLFIPFAALRGFDIAILTREQERLLVPRSTPGADRVEELSRRLAALRRGDAVTITHFVPVQYAGDAVLGEYAVTDGVFLRFEPEERTLLLREGRVELENLWELFPRDGEGEEEAL